MTSQQKKVVSFLGPAASYSHQAVRQAFSEDQWEYNPVVTIGDVFDVVQDSVSPAGLVPFENSTNGSVVFTLDYLADRHDRYPDVTVRGEVYVDVHHCLLGHKALHHNLEDGTEGSGTCTPTATDPSPPRPRTKPLSSLKHIQRIYSHPQAFGQCNAFISTYLKGVEVFEVSSTSKAAEIVSGDTTGTWAAISSQLAAETHGLDMLGRNIEDRTDNTTRFLIIGKDPKIPRDGDLTMPNDGQVGTKSMVSLTVPHDSPGALAKALSCFEEFGLNLTSINSRPSLLQPFHYIFFLEFRGHLYDDPGQKVKGCFEKLKDVAENWRWLGSWRTYR